MIDTDPTQGRLIINDIDDVLAILFLMAGSEVRIDGLTVTYGNSPLKRTLKVAHRTCMVTNRQDIPVLPGASRRGSRKPTPAARFIVEYFKQNAGKAVLVTLGPLTNLATALKMEPRLVEWIPAVLVMGGNLSAPFPLSLYKGFEFNSACDAPAMDKVLKSGLNIWLATADICMQARFGPQDLARLRRLNENCAALRLCDVDSWMKVNRLLLGSRGFVPWDPVAVAMLVFPEFYSDVRLMPLVMDLTGWKKRLKQDPESGKAGLIRVPWKLDVPAFTDALVARLSEI